MCQCSVSTREVVEPYVRLSVQDEGEEEANRYKWIESEKAGRDLGEWAILCWVKKHWNGFLRERWLEHLHGRTYWIELDCNDFGLLNRRFRGSVLFEQILAKLKAGQENLHIVNWAIDCHQPMDEVHEILVALDINSRRIEFELARRLTCSH
jgi:hypothetical protein